MKYFLLSCLLLAAVNACDDADNCPHTKQGDQITLADGTLARLSVVEDARCPCNVDCIWAGYIGMTITIGSDTILRVSDVFGRAFTSDSVYVDNLYYTNRGDRIMLLNYTGPDNVCTGSVAGEDFCLELAIE